MLSPILYVCQSHRSYADQKKPHAVLCHPDVQNTSNGFTSTVDIIQTLYLGLSVPYGLTLVTLSILYDFTLLYGLTWLPITVYSHTACQAHRTLDVLSFPLAHFQPRTFVVPPVSRNMIPHIDAHLTSFIQLSPASMTTTTFAVILFVLFSMPL